MRAAVRAMLLCACFAACAEIPSDPERSLERASGGTLRVGVTETPPWVVRRGDDAVGIEPDLVRAFARSIDARIEWIWASQDESMRSLEAFRLDLAIAGYSADSPWITHVAFTQPYDTTRIVVGARSDDRPPADESELRGSTVFVPVGAAIAAKLRSLGADVREFDLVAGPDARWIAAAEWRLRELGYAPGPLVLHRERRVLAVPPGENALLLAVDASLRGRRERTDMVANRPVSRAPSSERQ